MTMDELLISAGMPYTVSHRMVTDFVRNIGGKYIDGSAPVYYVVTTDDPPGYTFIHFDDHPVLLMSGIATRSDEADIDITCETVPIECSPCEVDQVAFAYHGNGIVVENTGGNVYFSAIATDRSLVNANEEVVNEVKSLIFAMRTGDSEMIFESIRRLSTIKKNIISENSNVKPRVRRTSYDLTPLQL